MRAQEQGRSGIPESSAPALLTSLESSRRLPDLQFDIDFNPGFEVEALSSSSSDRADEDEGTVERPPPYSADGWMWPAEPDDDVPSA